MSALISTSRRFKHRHGCDISSVIVSEPSQADPLCALEMWAQPLSFASSFKQMLMQDQASKLPPLCYCKTAHIPVLHVFSKSMTGKLSLFFCNNYHHVARKF